MQVMKEQSKETSDEAVAEAAVGLRGRGREARGAVVA